ncbi:MAG: ABC transporter permease [Clostridia bacterium]|nr:ABC transporter permease [Clostridia bacterium]
MEKVFIKTSFAKRVKSMLNVDFKRAFTSPLFYIMIGASLVMPVLILVMTTMMDGTVSTDPQTGVQTVMEGFKNAWQAIGAVSGASSAMDMSLTSMCNINMLYFLMAIITCIFVSDDFRSGYAKNIFTVRAKKNDYVLSKTLVCFIGSACMLVAFFVGTVLGGAIAGLPFDTEGFNAGNLLACMLSKILLSSAFVSIYLLASVIAKQKTWLAILLSFGIGMLFYTVAPMVAPLDSNIINVLLCAVGGVGMSVGLGAISNIVLNKTALV